MKQYLKPFLNWRIDVLSIIAIVAALLILGECDNLSTLMATKVVGFGLAYACYKLSQKWDKQGLIDELKIFDVQ